MHIYYIMHIGKLFTFGNTCTVEITVFRVSSESHVHVCTTCVQLYESYTHAHKILYKKKNIIIKYI